MACTIQKLKIRPVSQMLPLTLNAAGGLDGIRSRVDATLFQIDGIGALVLEINAQVPLRD